jgi:nucleotide-binding universal stress UspA family protein
VAQATKPYAIVAAVDASDATDVVLEHALDEANRHASAAVHVVGVVPTGFGLFHRTRDHSGDVEELEGVLTTRVRDALSTFDGSDVGVTLHVRAGVPAEEILDVIEEAEASLVVLGRTGWGRARRGFVGSVSERVARTAPCSVLLARTPDYEAHEAAREAPCEACAQIRTESAGERWFCQEHTSDDAHRRISTLRPSGGMALKPGGLF